MLRYWFARDYDRVSERDLFGPLETTSRNGTEPEPIAAYLTRAGLDARYRHGDVTLEEHHAEPQRRGESRRSSTSRRRRRDQPRPWPEVWDAGHYALAGRGSTTTSTSSSWTRACSRLEGGTRTSRRELEERMARPSRARPDAARFAHGHLRPGSLPCPGPRRGRARADAQNGVTAVALPGTSSGW